MPYYITERDTLRNEGRRRRAPKTMARTSTTLAENSSAPEFRLTSAQGKEFSLAELLAGRRALALVFLRGTW